MAKSRTRIDVYLPENLPIDETRWEDNKRHNDDEHKSYERWGVYLPDSSEYNWIEINVNNMDHTLNIWGSTEQLMQLGEAIYKQCRDKLQREQEAAIAAMIEEREGERVEATV